MIQINEKSTEQQGEQLASSVSSALRKRLSLDLESLAVSIMELIGFHIV